jgi:hypothetical protein
MTNPPTKKPVGKVKQLLAAGDPPLFALTPIFDRRTVTIEGKKTEQVLLSTIGGMSWINVDLRDITTDSD